MSVTCEENYVKLVTEKRLTGVPSQSFIPSFSLWVIKLVLLWNNGSSWHMHYHCPVPVIRSHCSQ